MSDRLRSGPSFSSSLFCYLAPDASLFTLCSRFAYPNEARSVPESINRRFSFRLLNTRHPPDPPRICQESKNLYRWPGALSITVEGEKIEKEKGEEIAARTPISARFPSPNEETEELLFIPDNEQVVRLSFLLPLRYTSDCQLQRQRELPATRRTEEPEAKNPPTSVFLSRCNKLLPPWLLTTVLHQF